MFIEAAFHVEVKTNEMWAGPQQCLLKDTCLVYSEDAQRRLAIPSLGDQQRLHREELFRLEQGHGVSGRLQ